jgi:hypothetical protein
MSDMMVVAQRYSGKGDCEVSALGKLILVGEGKTSKQKWRQ